MLDNRADTRQEALAHGFQRVSVGSEQPEPCVVIVSLQRLQIGLNVLGVEFRFQTLQTAPPELAHGFPIMLGVDVADPASDPS